MFNIIVFSALIGSSVVLVVNYLIILHKQKEHLESSPDLFLETLNNPNSLVYDRATAATELLRNGYISSERTSNAGTLYNDKAQISRFHQSLTPDVINRINKVRGATE